MCHKGATDPPHSPYDSRSVLIVIGKQRCNFNVLESFLKEKTSFFDRHGAPPTSEEKDGSSGTNLTNTGTDMENAVDLDIDLDIKAEEGSTNVTETAQAATVAAKGVASPRKAKAVPHYHITSKIHTPQAFKTFVDWLHNVTPEVPEENEDCKFCYKHTCLRSNTMQLHCRTLSWTASANIIQRSLSIWTTSCG